MDRLIEIINFSRIFADENYEDYLHRIKEIPRSLLVDSSTYLLSSQFNRAKFGNHTELLGKWFGQENNVLANRINDKINNYVNESHKQVTIINTRASLTLFEMVLSNDNETHEISSADFEVLLFKIYLALNQQLDIKEVLLLQSAQDYPNYPNHISLAIGISLPTFDINYDSINHVFVTQIVKAIYLFEFLNNREDTQKLLTDFYEKFQVNDFQDYLKKVFPIAFSIVSTNNEGKIDLVIDSEDVDFESKCSFLDKMTINRDNYIEADVDVDYINLRANPLYKIDRNTYRIIYSLFAIEKNFNGLYFLLKEINDSYPKKEQLHLREIITFDFSEKFLLYTLIEKSYLKRYFKLPGDMMKTPGAPDYYMRNGNKIFIFESKDVLINAQIKDSYDFAQYDAVLKEKLYFSLGVKNSNKAVKQLAGFSKTILNGSFKEDSNYKSKSAKIYPIIILHNRQLDIFGLNNLINIWFNSEIDDIKNEGIDTSNLKMPTIISIDTFIAMHERLGNKEFELDDIIDKYQDWIDVNRLRKKKFKTEEESINAHHELLIPFNVFFNAKYDWIPPDLFREKINSIL